VEFRLSLCDAQHVLHDRFALRVNAGRRLLEIESRNAGRELPAALLGHQTAPLFFRPRRAASLEVSLRRRAITGLDAFLAQDRKHVIDEIATVHGAGARLGDCFSANVVALAFAYRFDGSSAGQAVKRRLRCVAATELFLALAHEVSFVAL